MPEKFLFQQLPSSWDWRAQGKVTSVKDQGPCGSCYAFAAVGNVESKMLMDGAGSHDFSENNAKECNRDELAGTGAGSCDGGNYDMAAAPNFEEIRLTEEDNGCLTELGEGQILVISLESNPSTGYSWQVAEINEDVLRQVGESEFEQMSPLLGAPEKQILRFRPVGPGQSNLKLIYHRPWEKGVKPIREFFIQVVGPPATVPEKGLTKPAVEGFAHSDSSIAFPEGAYVDDIVLRKVRGQPTTPTPTPTPGTPGSLPDAFDWRDYGGDTAVKNQGSCGGCWAFGTVGPLEANIKIKDGIEEKLAEQYLLSCNTDGWDCDGGWWAHDYHWWKKPPSEPEAGAVYEADFPYVAWDAPCNGPYSHPYRINSWTFVGNEFSVPSTEAIKQAIYDHGPVAAAVCVGNAFQSYSGGVFEINETCDYVVNHAIVLVGWDDNQGTNGVWILKNSWGPGWGEGGYMRIGYGVSQVGYSANYVIYNSQDPTRGFIDFDDVIAPCHFDQIVPLRNRYAAQGIWFWGNAGGGILNECGNFDVTSHSSPNFLAFDHDATFEDGSTPTGPEFVFFWPLADYVEVVGGAGWGATGYIWMLALDYRFQVVGFDYATVQSQVQPMSISAPSILLVVLGSTSSDDAYIFDDLRWHPMWVGNEVEGGLDIDALGPVLKTLPVDSMVDSLLPD
jgi:C1A family cysteine protease